jgi:hypothetical protein
LAQAKQVIAGKTVSNLLNDVAKCGLPISTVVFHKHLKDKNKVLRGLLIPSNFDFVIHTLLRRPFGGRRRAD